jgi:hypothetical protein
VIEEESAAEAVLDLPAMLEVAEDFFLSRLEKRPSSAIGGDDGRSARVLVLAGGALSQAS